MDGEATTIGGIVIPSTDPLFLAVVIGVHIPLGIACVITGASAMLSRKGRGRHSRFGTIYFWCLLALFVSATLLSVMRWSENYHLFILAHLRWLAVQGAHRNELQRLASTSITSRSKTHWHGIGRSAARVHRRMSTWSHVAS